MFPSPEELQVKIDAYFVDCDNATKKESRFVRQTTEDDDGNKLTTDVQQIVDVPDPKRYTLSGLALYLDCDRDTLANYGKKDEFFGTIRRAKLRVLNQMENNLIANNGSAPGHIFILKNGFGMVDRSEVAHSELPLGDELNGLEEGKAKQLDNDTRPQIEGQTVPDRTLVQDQGEGRGTVDIHEEFCPVALQQAQSQQEHHPEEQAVGVHNG